MRVCIQGPATAEQLKADGEIKLLSGEVNLLATQLRLDRDHDNVVEFANGKLFDPNIDVSLVGADLKARVKGIAMLNQWHAQSIV